MLWRPRIWQKRLSEPGRSGIVAANTASRRSPISARSETWRRRSKLTLAPDAPAARLLPRQPAAGLPHGDAVGEDADVIEFHPPPALERAVHGVGVLGLDADDFHRRADLLHVRRDAGYQPAAAHRDEDRVEISRMLL